jgi:hypothetical protein
VLFSTGADSVLPDLLAMPDWLAQAMFFVSAPIAMAGGLYVHQRAKGAMVFSILSLCHFIISLVALISFVSVYCYELPTHHCPFCILHQEYGYIGYFLYAAMLLGAVFGMGTGVIDPFRSIASLRQIIPRVERKLALTSILASAVFLGITGWVLLFSNLSM